MDILCKIVSWLFHPLLMVSYGMGLVLTQTLLAIYPMRVKGLLEGGVLLSTALIPGFFIWLLVRNGAAKDMELSDRRERSLPYLIFLTALLSCLYFLYRMMMSFWLLWTLGGACVALGIALFVNFAWKISAHMIGIGGLLGGVMGVARMHSMNPYWLFILLFLVAGLVGTARIYLKKHTPTQVYAGFCLGFICTFVASLMSYIYLFI